jgi:nitroreductase
MLKKLIEKNRSYRRFDGDHAVSDKILKEVINLARISGSAGNKQPIKYKVINNKKENDIIFQNIKWAAYLTEWSGPTEEERPTAYIIALHDKKIDQKAEFVYFDLGLASQNILLGLAEKKLGGCMIGSINKDNVKKELSISDDYEIILIIAVGKPVEKIVLEDVEKDGSIKYYRDYKNVHYVPKRKLDDILI